MPSVYTIEGAAPPRRRKAKSAKQKAHQKRFKRAAKTCKGQSQKAFRACMRRELKK